MTLEQYRRYHFSAVWALSLYDFIEFNCCFKPEKVRLKKAAGSPCYTPRNDIIMLLARLRIVSIALLHTRYLPGLQAAADVSVVVW